MRHLFLIACTAWTLLGLCGCHTLAKPPKDEKPKDKPKDKPGGH